MFVQVYPGAMGAGSNLTVKTGRSSIIDEAKVSNGTSDQGHGGNLAVNASDLVELSGTTPDRQSVSGLYTQTQGAGAAGDLTITTGNQHESKS